MEEGGHKEDVQVHGVGWCSGYWRDRVQWMARVVLQPRSRSLVCLPVLGVILNALSSRISNAMI